MSRDINTQERNPRDVMGRNINVAVAVPLLESGTPPAGRSFIFIYFVNAIYNAVPKQRQITTLRVGLVLICISTTRPIFRFVHTIYAIIKKKRCHLHMCSNE